MYYAVRMPWAHVVARGYPCSLVRADVRMQSISPEALNL
eukprot:COSAG02_NODE_2161_length_9626_cov_89.931983_4_plen_39_part_00